MPRPDVLTTLRRLARELDYFRADHAVIYQTAHGALDVLGAFNADSGGTLAQMTLPSQAAVAVQFLSEPVLRIRSGQMVPPVGEPEVCLPLNGTENGTLPAPAAWAAGILALWRHLDPPAPGAAILIHSAIPMAAGQASATAILAATALALMSGDGPPAPLGIAQAVAAAEARAAGHTGASHGDVITAMTALHPRPGRPELLRYSAQPHRLVGPVPLPEDVRLLALDTGVRYSGAPGSGMARAAALQDLCIAGAMGYRIIETIYRDLGRNHTPLNGYLANTSPLLYRQYFRALLPRRLRGSDFLRTFGGPVEGGLGPAAGLDRSRVYPVRTAVDHLITENEHAEQFLQAMEDLADLALVKTPRWKQEVALTLARAGRLLLASHHSYRLRLDLSCREADWLVDRLMEAGPERGIYGARITRTGGGGTLAALLDRSAAATDALLEAMHAYQKQTGLSLGITEA